MEVDIGTEEDDMHAKEYALALQRVVLENADEIFTAWILKHLESLFCHNVYLIMGIVLKCQCN